MLDLKKSFKKTLCSRLGFSKETLLLKLEAAYFTNFETFLRFSIKNSYNFDMCISGAKI